MIYLWRREMEIEENIYLIINNDKHARLQNLLWRHNLASKQKINPADQYCCSSLYISLHYKY